MRDSILILSGIFPPDVGGPAKFADVFSQWLSEKKWKAKVISFSEKGPRRQTVGKVEVNLIPRRLNLFWRYVVVIFQIYRDSRKVKVILGNGLFIELWFASKIFGLEYAVKVPGDIVWERAKNQSITSKTVDEFQNEDLNWKYRIFREIYSRSLRDASQVIVPSQHLFELCELWGVPKSKLYIIHNSVFINSFEAVTLKKDIDVLTVSRLVKWKRIDEVIKVCAKSKLKLMVVGSGPEMQNLSNIAMRSGADVTFTGEVSQQNLPRFYSRSKCFVLNSDFEASSYSLLEAMACSLPVIASRKTGSAEVVRHAVDGYLVDEDYLLSDAISDLFAKPRLAIEMGERARERIENNFNSERNFHRITEILTVGLR